MLVPIVPFEAKAIKNEHGQVWWSKGNENNNTPVLFLLHGKTQGK